MSDDVEAGPIAMIRRIVPVSQSVADHALRAAGLNVTSAQWIPLQRLYVQDAESVIELARACGTDVSSMSRMLDRLREKGLVDRQRAMEDTRRIVVSLTHDGRRVARKVFAVLRNVDARLLEGFRPGEKFLVLSLLRRLSAAGQVAGAMPHPGDDLAIP